ncbi:MAG: pimeloyl-ACP methyl ester carboxylesterase, partial [Bacillariaceae sp.]|jgi:pimeloyl-ACP methyl ester carboxylesterase
VFIPFYRVPSLFTPIFLHSFLICAIKLSTEFEIWCMTITMEDRSTYKELKAVVLDFMKNGLAFNDEENNMLQQNKTSSVNGGGGGLFNTGWFGGGNTKINEQKGIGNRPIYIAGESFGGILALDVASTILAEQKKKKIDADLGINLKGLVLINPATCYDRSQLAIAGPKVATTPSIFYILSLFSQLVPLFTDEFSFEQLFLILQAKALPSVIDNPSREAYMGRVAISLPTKLEFMPSSTLSWRLEEWLENGCVALGESSLSFRDFQSLIVVGENDKTLPSIAEAERLASKVMSTTKTQIHVVDGAGHASTCGSRLDLAAVIRNRFPELQKNTATSKRTSMKPLAKQGVGANFGMEKRYDKADFGLNPFLYWSKNNYLPVQQKKEGRSIRVRENQHLISYKKTVYKVAD